MVRGLRRCAIREAILTLKCYRVLDVARGFSQGHFDGVNIGTPHPFPFSPDETAWAKLWIVRIATRYPPAGVMLEMHDSLIDAYEVWGVSRMLALIFAVCAPPL